MIEDIWDKIAYIVQLLFACFVFMLPARKRKMFWIRVGMASLIFVVSAYILNMIFIVSSLNMMAFIYWAYYIILCAVFAYIGLDGSMKQAIYCAACALAMQHIAFDICLIYQILRGDNYLVFVLIYLIVYASFYYFFARNLTENGLFTFHKNTLFPIVTIVILVWILSIMEDSILPTFTAGSGQRIIYRLIDALCCFYVLWVQVNQKKNFTLEHELEAMNYRWSQQKRQYEITSETIGNINRKCHDLKHQIRAHRQMTDEKEKEEFLKGLEHDVMIYDTVMKTGNQALDIVLMEKGLFCKDHNIQWTCMADGFRLDFMKNEDIYAIFGNAFDNAISAVMELPDMEKHVISVKMINQNQLLTIQIQNYFDKQLKFEDGLPKTTQKNKQIHGYGMKSIRYTAEKYNGTSTVNIENKIFMLQILIPIPDTLIFDNMKPNSL